MVLRALPLMNDSAFNTFWKHYPRHEKKQAAKDAFRWAMQHFNADGQLLVRMVVTLTWQLEMQRDAKYWQMPDKWLLGQRWDDERPADIPDPEWAKIEAWVKEGK